MRILVADTDVDFLEILQSYLWDRGHETEIATNGLECIATLREFGPEVLLLGDELLWGGCEGVLALMVDDSSLRPTPIILMGDINLDGSLPLALRSRISKSLLKPTRLGDVEACINATNRSSKGREVPQRLAVSASH